MMVDAKVIKHVAKLAKLEIPDSELNVYCEQLIKVLNQFEEIKLIPTENVEPLITPIEIENFYRNDVIVSREEKISTAELLNNAPDKDGNLFSVPPVI